MWILYLSANGTVKAKKKLTNYTSGCGDLSSNGDRFGSSIALLGDIDGAGGAENALAVGSIGIDDVQTQSGGVWILSLNDLENVIATQDITNLNGGLGAVLDVGDEFGRGVAAIGDLNSDGVPDLAVGVALDDDGFGDAGAVYILFLNANGTVNQKQKISSTAGGFTGPLGGSANFGISVAPMGDLDADGNADLAVGAAGDSDGALLAGAAWILYLDADGTVRYARKLSNLAGGFGGTIDARDSFGCSVAAVGDLDGDGRDDLVAGVMSDDDGANDAGAVWALFLDCRPMASTTNRNPMVGGHTNPDVYAVTGLPVLGGTLTASVTTSSPTDTVLLVGYAQGGQLNLVWGNVLVDILHPAGDLLHGPTAIGNPAVIDVNVPHDFAYLGATLATQALRIGTVVDLTNAQDIVVGW